MKNAITQKLKPVPFPVKIDEINSLADYYPVPYDTIFRICYIYGARISEVLKLTRRDLEVKKDANGRDCLVCKLLTAKNPNNPLRTLPAIIGGNSLTSFQREEAAITERVYEYLEGFSPESKLFPEITRQKVYNHFSVQTLSLRALDGRNRKMIDMDDFKIHPHFLRHCRLTHLVEEYNYDGYNLMQYAGWSDLKPARIYLQLDWHYLARGMKQEEWL